MALLSRSKVYDRKRLLEAANEARRRGRRQKAIELYREVLAVEPDNLDLHRRVAPLLAATRQVAAAWTSYQRTVEGLVEKGFLGQAVGVLRDASARIPLEPGVWMLLADVEVARGRPVDAHRVLLEARQKFRSKKHRRLAISLMERARQLAPDDFATGYDLAGLLARDGSRAQALRLLEELARQGRRRGELRRLRGRQLRLRPSVGGLLRWLRALLLGC